MIKNRLIITRRTPTVSDLCLSKQLAYKGNMGRSTVDDVMMLEFTVEKRDMF